MRLNLFCAIAASFWMASVRKLDFQARVRALAPDAWGGIGYISDCAFFFGSLLFLWLGKHTPLPPEQNTNHEKNKGDYYIIYLFSSFFIFDDVCILTKRILLFFSRDR